MCRLSDCKSICMSPCLLVYLSSWLSGRVASRNFLFFSDDWFALGNSVYNSYSSGGLFWSIVLAFYSPLDLTKVIPFNERFGYSIGRQKQSLNPSTVRKCKSALFWSGREQQMGGGARQMSKRASHCSVFLRFFAHEKFNLSTTLSDIKWLSFMRRFLSLQQILPIAVITDDKWTLQAQYGLLCALLLGAMFLSLGNVALRSYMDKFYYYDYRDYRFSILSKFVVALKILYCSVLTLPSTAILENRFITFWALW